MDRRLSHDDRHLALGGWGLWIVDLTRHVTEAPLVSASDSDATRYLEPLVAGRLLVAFTYEDEARRRRRSNARRAVRRSTDAVHVASSESLRPRDGLVIRRRYSFTLDAGGGCRTRSHGCATFGRPSRAICSNRVTAFGRVMFSPTCAGSFMSRPSRRRLPCTCGPSRVPAVLCDCRTEMERVLGGAPTDEGFCS